MLRWSRLIVRWITGSVITAMVLAAALAWRVAQEPVSVGFLAPYVTQALADAEAGIGVSFDDVVLAWDGDNQALRLRVVEARFARDDGAISLRVPEIDLGVSGAALLRGVVAPTFVRAAGIDARLLRSEEGRFLLGLPAADDARADDAAGPSDEMATGMLARLFDILSQPYDPDDPFGRLQAVTIEVSRLVIDDRKLGQRITAPGAQLRVLRGEGGARAAFSAALDWRGRRVNLSADGTYFAAEHAGRVSARFQGVELADFADLTPEFAPLSGLRMPLSGLVEFRVSPMATIEDVQFDFLAGAGTVSKPDLLAETIGIAEARLRGAVIADGAAIAIDDASVAFVDRLHLAATGVLTREQPGRYGLELSGDLHNLPTDALRRYWPPAMAKNARDWVTKNVRGGQVAKAKLALKLSPDMLDGKIRLPRNAIRLDFEIDKATVDYFAPLTKLTEASGQAVLDADELNIAVSGGRIGPLAVGAGKVRIWGLQDRDQFIEVTAPTTGESRDVLALIDQKPLGYPSQLGIKPATVGGRSSVLTTLRFPLENKLKLDDIKFSARAELFDLELPRAYDDINLSNGRMILTADPKGLDAKGEAALNGVPVSLSWRQEFDSKAAVSARYTLSGKVDSAGRKALGFDLMPYLDGPGQAEIDVESRGNHRETLVRAAFDLTDSTLTLDELHWKKPPGRIAEAKFRALIRPGQPTRFEDFTIKSGDFDALGTWLLAADKSWRMDIARLKLGPNDVAGRIERAANGNTKMALTGQRFDLTRYVEEADAEEPSAAQARPRLDIALKLAEAQVDANTVIRDFALDLKRGSLDVETLDLTGNFAKGGALSLRIAPDGSGRNLALRTDNAAAMFLYLGVENIEGGTMAVDARYQDDRPGKPLAGKLVARNFKAVRTPFLARLLGIGSFTGLAALLSGEGIQFETAEVPFVQKERVLTIQPSRIQGPQLGITLEGTINRKTDQVNVTGTAVPAFVLNTILGKIPVLGDLFVGEGIIGVNFAVTGPRDKTDMTVNPLSAIAPGFLRRIFQAGSSADPSAPDAGPRPQLPPPGQSQ